MKTRKSKIARLPLDVREELNRRLENGEPGTALVAWLNGLPEIKGVMAAHFGGRAITEQNVSEWRAGGHQDWLAQEEEADRAREFAEAAQKLGDSTKGRLTDHLATVLALRFADLLTRWKGPVTGELRGQMEFLRAFRKDGVALRRSEHEDARVAMAQQRLEWEGERFEWETETADDESIQREWDRQDQLRKMRNHCRYLEQMDKMFSEPPPAERDDEKAEGEKAESGKGGMVSGAKDPTTDSASRTGAQHRTTSGETIEHEGTERTARTGIQDQVGESKEIQGNPTKSNLLQGKNEMGTGEEVENLGVKELESLRVEEDAKGQEEGEMHRATGGALLRAPERGSQVAAAEELENGCGSERPGVEPLAVDSANAEPASVEPVNPEPSPVEETKHVRVDAIVWPHRTRKRWHLGLEG